MRASRNHDKKGQMGQDENIERLRSARNQMKESREDNKKEASKIKMEEAMTLAA